MTDLKPCPFCGGDATNRAQNPIGEYSGPVVCEGCGIVLVTVMAWNTRPEAPSAEEAKEQTRLALWEQVGIQMVLGQPRDVSKLLTDTEKLIMVLREQTASHGPDCGCQMCQRRDDRTVAYCKERGLPLPPLPAKGSPLLNAIQTEAPSAELVEAAKRLLDVFERSRTGFGVGFEREQIAVEALQAALASTQAKEAKP